jgi:hypothetical protein
MLERFDMKEAPHRGALLIFEGASNIPRTVERRAAKAAPAQEFPSLSVVKIGVLRFEAKPLLTAGFDREPLR